MVTWLAQRHILKVDPMSFCLHPTSCLQHSEDRRVRRYWARCSPQWSPEETLFPRGPHLAPRCQPAGEAPVPARASGPQPFGSPTPATPQRAERQKTHIPVSVRDGARPQTAVESEVLL